MNENSRLFNNNEGIGGFEQGLYDNMAVQPTEINWTRQSCYNIPESPKLLWKATGDHTYLGGTQLGGSFAIGKDKAIIVTECNIGLNSHDGKLIQINKHGTITELFHNNVTLRIPVIGKDGLIYVSTFASSGSTGHKLFCLFPDGKVKWEYFINYSVQHRPVIDKDGNIYVFTYDDDRKGALLSISEEGILNWEHKFNSINWFEPTISEEGIIYIGLNVTKTLCAFNKKGEMLWEKPIGQGLGYKFMNMRDDGTIFVCLTGTLHALDNCGNIKWTYKNGTSNVCNTPALARNGKLYLNRTPYFLVSLDSEGNELWKADLKNIVMQAPIIARDGKILQTTFMHSSPRNKSWVHVVTPDGKILWEYEMEGNVMSAFIAGDNLIYVITNIYRHSKKGVAAKWEIHAIGEAKEE